MKEQTAPDATETPTDIERGLYRKYDVRRLNDSARKHAHCEYYVLDLMHDKFSADALEAYSRACAKEFPALAVDLFAKAGTVRSNADHYAPTKEAEINLLRNRNAELERELALANSKLLNVTQERDDLKADYLRRHNDALDAKERCRELESKLAAFNEAARELPEEPIVVSTIRNADPDWRAAPMPSVKELLIYTDAIRTIATAAIAKLYKCAPLLNEYSQQIDDQRRRAEAAEASLAEHRRDAERWKLIRRRIWCSNGLMLSVSDKDFSEHEAVYVDKLADAALAAKG